jgi:MFS family permease
MVIFLLIVYIVWLKLVDRKRGVKLLLIGSLAAVGYIFNCLVLTELFNVMEFKIRILPMPAIFISSISVPPIFVMLAEQYTSSWKGYILWSGLSFAFYSFVLLPVFSLMGILQLHNWSVFYQFLIMFGISLGVRLVFLWIVDTQKRKNEKAAQE